MNMPNATSAAAPGTVEFWFDFASNYSYPSIMRIEAEAARRGANVVWRPILLGAIFRSFGWNTSPFVLQPIKGAYVWKDMVRQCRKYGLEWTPPSRFPRSALLPLRVACFGAEQPWIGAFCKRIATLNFVDDQDIEDTDRVAQVLTNLGLSAAPIIAQALGDANKLALRRQTEAARTLGIFGAPSFVVDGEIYWGDDRLDDALDRCAELCR